jgi:LysM repeat protein
MYKRLFVMVIALGVVAVMSGTAAAAEAAPEAKPAEASKPPKTVEVQSGDSLSLIAQAQALESWVPLWNANTGIEHPDMIYPGQQLVVPEGPTPERPLPTGVVVQSVAVAQPQPVKPTGAVRKAAPANYAAGAGGILARIRQKESGGNYAINTGNGYYGAYQFDLRTWHGVGGTGLPSEASPAEQDMRAQMLYDRRGCSPWPNTCY